MGNEQPMQYVSGGAYSFSSPECDTKLNAEYVKVTTKLETDPAQTRISVVQTRSGDRKHPQIVTEVKNSRNSDARYVDGKQDHSVEVQPVLIHVEHNGNGQTIDRTVRWLVDDTDLLENRSETGYTMKDASVLPNMNSAFIVNIINRKCRPRRRTSTGRRFRIRSIPGTAVVSAVTNPETSVNHQALTQPPCGGGFPDCGSDYGACGDLKPESQNRGAVYDYKKADRKLLSADGNVIGYRSGGADSRA